jgi:hypothetical protein
VHLPARYFLGHVTRSTGSPGDPPTGGWFDRDTNRRAPETFPAGLPSNVADPDLELSGSPARPL